MPIRYQNAKIATRTPSRSTRAFTKEHIAAMATKLRTVDTNADRLMVKFAAHGDYRRASRTAVVMCPATDRESGPALNLRIALTARLK
jgi:hypothetical protein